MPQACVLKLPKTFYPSFERFIDQYEISEAQPLPTSKKALEKRDADRQALDDIGSKLQAIQAGTLDPQTLPERESGARELGAPPWVAFIKLDRGKQPPEVIVSPIFCKDHKEFSAHAVDDALVQAEKEIANQ